MVQPRSRLARIAPPLAATYVAVLIAVLLLPFNFSAPDSANSAQWHASGVDFGTSGMLVSAEPPARVFRALTSGTGMTIELWLKTASVDQQGPARIFSYSIDPWVRNFTVGQEARHLTMRLRTTATDLNGKPSVDVADAFVAGEMQHIVVTYDFRTERVYVDGALKAESVRPKGDFANWNPSFYLVFGNELSGGRPWAGEIAYAALYNRAVDGHTIRTRHDTGSRAAGVSPPAGLVAEFDFAQGPQGGDPAADRYDPPLERPQRVGKSRLFFTVLNGSLLWAEPGVLDMIANMILFSPFGVIVFVVARRHVGTAARATLFTTAAAATLAVTVEFLQYFLDARTSSVFDLAANTAGALIGAIGCQFWLWRAAGFDGPREG